MYAGASVYRPAPSNKIIQERRKAVYHKPTPQQQSELQQFAQSFRPSIGRTHPSSSEPDDSDKVTPPGVSKLDIIMSNPSPLTRVGHSQSHLGIFSQRNAPKETPAYSHSSSINYSSPSLKAHAGDMINRCIHSALYGDEPSELLSLSGDHAKTALDEMWKLLDRPPKPGATTGIQSYPFRNKLRRFTLKLAINSDRLPTAFLLDGVRCTDTNTRGVGGYADVLYGSLDDSPVAIKRIRLYTGSTESQKKKLKRDLYRESLLWKNLSHEHVLPLLGVSEDVFTNIICMILPWMDNGSLRHYIDVLLTEGRLSVEFIDQWLFEVALGLAYLHAEGIVHGDLHGGNILVDGNGSIRLTDFGMSLIADATSYQYASIHGGGATRWKAPELIDPDLFDMESTRPTYASDVYALGCIFIELYTGKPPFAELSDRQVTVGVLKGTRPARPTLPDGSMMSEPMWSLTESCWVASPLERPKAKLVAQKLETIISSRPPLPEGATTEQDRLVALCTPETEFSDLPSPSVVSPGASIDKASPSDDATSTELTSDADTSSPDELSFSNVATLDSEFPYGTQWQTRATVGSESNGYSYLPSLARVGTGTNVAVTRTLRMHPLLAYTWLHRAPITYDVTFTPSARTVLDRTTQSAIPSHTLSQPATDPPTSSSSRLVLRSHKFPWPVVVGPSGPRFTIGPSKRSRSSSANAITNLDVLYAIHATLLTPVTPDEWESLGRGSRAQQKVTKAYEKRCTRMGGGWEAGVKRIDWLGSMTRLVGVEVDKSTNTGKLIFAKP